MSYGLFLNFEKVSIKIIEDNIKVMTNDNLFTYEEDVPDEINEEVFVKNLYYGSIAITFIANLFETAINTMLTKRIGIVGEEFLMLNTFTKIELICKICNTDFNKINGHREMQKMRDAIKLRNDITHFKNNELGEGTFIIAKARIPKGSSKKPMAEEFTQKKMQEYYDNTIKLLKLICKSCRYKINDNCSIFDCDGRDDEYEYII